MKRALAIVLIVLAGLMAVACNNNDNPIITAPTPPPIVVAPPVISQFGVDVANPRLLVWTVTADPSVYTQVRITPVIGDVQLVGSQLVTPDTYTIVAKNDGGQVSRSYTVK